jgi:ribosomal protein S18 acetylase RimI-like enzyme
MAGDAARIRRVELPADELRIRAIDTSFETDRVYRVVAEGSGFRLVEESISPPVTKRFPLDDFGDRRNWDRGWLAEVGGEPAGFIATAYQAWNRRAIVWHFYVSSAHRRRGIGRRLLEAAIADGVERGAASVWLETTSVNVPGVTAYRRLGFEICGLDVSLYEGTAAEEEVALFLRRQLRDGPRTGHC